MKKKYYANIILVIAFLFSLIANNIPFLEPISQKKIREVASSNMNIAYLSFLYQGDFFNLIGEKVVSNEYIDVKDYQINKDILSVYPINSEVKSNFNGVISKIVFENGEYSIEIQTFDNKTYTYSCLSSINYKLYQKVQKNLVIGKTNKKYYTIQSRNLDISVFNFIIDYEEA